MPTPQQIMLHMLLRLTRPDAGKTPNVGLDLAIRQIRSWLWHHIPALLSCLLQLVRLARGEEDGRESRTDPPPPLSGPAAPGRIAESIQLLLAMSAATIDASFALIEIWRD
ncbi:hypothetical protein V2G26_004213 [Clonostachys chloroleuca]